MTKSSYSINVEGEVVIVTAFGVQSLGTVQAIQHEVKRLLESKDGPKDVLVVMKGQGMPDEATAKVALKGIYEIPFRRMAVVGATPSRIVTVRRIQKKATEELEHMKLFHREEDARTWLADYQAQT